MSSKLSRFRLAAPALVQSRYRTSTSSLGLSFLCLTALPSVSGQAVYSYLDVNVAVEGAPELITAGDLVVGDTGTGFLHADGNAQISNQNGYVGSNIGSNGQVVFTNGVTWTNSGDLNVGYFGQGDMEIDPESTVSSTNGVIGAGSGSNGSVRISDGVWTNSGGLYVGNYGQGSLSVYNSNANLNAVSASTAVLGYHPGAVGTVELQVGKISIADFLVVGQLGAGVLSIQNGSVTNTDGYIGLAPGSGGTATVSTGGSWLNSGRLIIGQEGYGALGISQGTVTNTEAYVGLEPGSSGSVTLADGVWSSSGNLTVGFEGFGSVFVENGGLLTADAIEVAVRPDSAGNVFALGLITTSQISEGEGSGSVVFIGGSLRLSGNQSALFSGFETNDVTLVDATIDTQAFEVTTAAAVTISGSLTKKGSGTLTLALDGLSLGPEAITIEDGAINYKLVSGQDIDGILAGTGALTKTGNGAQTLNSANTYSGPTIISGGTLVLSNSGSFDFSPVINLGTSDSQGTLDLTAKIGSFTFGTNQTVSGYGTINIGAGKTVNIFGNLAPGNSPGVTTFIGDLSLAPTTISTMEIVGLGGVAGTDFDQVVVTGTLTFDGTLLINTTGLSGLVGGESFLLFDAANYGSPGLDSVSISGTAYNPGSLVGTLGVWTVTDGLSNLTFTFTEANGRLTVTAIPEPATYATLLGLGMVGVAAYRRRRAKV